MTGGFVFGNDIPLLKINLCVYSCFILQCWVNEAQQTESSFKSCTKKNICYPAY